MRPYQLDHGHGHGSELESKLTEQYRSAFIEFMLGYENGVKEADLFRDFYRGRYRVQIGGDLPTMRDLFSSDSAQREQLRWFYQHLSRVDVTKRMLWVVYSFIALPWLGSNAESSVSTFCQSRGIQVDTDMESMRRRGAEWANTMDKVEDHQRRKTA